MTTSNLYLRDLVAVDADFKPSVQLPFDFDNPSLNERLVRSFIPTSQSIEILTEIARSLDPNSSERARAIVGTFGTGKSDLLLILCNYLARQVDDPLMAPFYERLRSIDPPRAGIIRARREGHPPFLVVLLQADTVSSFPGFVLHGLQHALEKAELGHLMQKTRYAAAIEQIEAWQKDGHVRYADFCKTLEDHEKIDVSGLLAALRGPQSDDALRRFLRTFKAVTGSEFNVYGYSQPHEAYAGVAEALVASGRYSGILLVCDEFTAFLEKFQRAIDQQLREFEAETKAVENLAERAGSSGRAQVHFIVASLESFASAAGGINSRSVADATERSGGRFKQHSLLVQGGEELIRGAIKRLPAADGIELLTNTQRDELLSIANDIWGRQKRDRQWMRDVIVEGSFPLHPISTYALPLVNQRVAQSSRTMFIFLKEEKGLRGFIQREQLRDVYPGWNRLLTPDVLFDYFRESIVTKRSDIHEAFEHAEQQIRAATVDTTLALRVLKIVALCETVGSDLVMRPTHAFLRRALNLPPAAESDLEAALNLLEQLDAIEPPSEIGSDAGMYRLPMRGWVSVKNLHRRITARAQNLGAPDAVKLQSFHTPETIQASEYNRRRGSHRKLSGYYVSLNNLRSRERLRADLEDSRNRDGLLWYVICTSDVERAEAQSLARDLTGQHNRLVVAVPIVPSQVLSALRDYQALENLRHDPELDQVSKPYLADTGKVGHEYKSRLDYELRQLANHTQWEWFAAGRGQSGLNANAVIGLASQMMEKVFPDTPTTNLAQHFKPDDFGSTITKAVEQIIKGSIQLAKTGKSSVSAADNVLRTGAVSLGLLQLQHSEGAFETYNVNDPNNSASLASGKIWRKMTEHLAAGKPWASLVRELRQAPFGLYDSILILFLAAFIARNADSLSVSKAGLGSRACDIDPNLLKGMLEKPQDYTIRYTPISESEKRWLRGIVDRGLGVTDFALPAGTTLRAAVASRVKTWLTRQQIPLFALSFDGNQIAKLIPDSDPVVLAGAELLLKSQSGEHDLASVLLTDLPHALGAPEQHTVWNQATVDTLIVNWINVCDLLARLPEVLHEQTVLRAAALFGAENQPPEHRWIAIHNWRLTRGAIPPTRLQGLSRELFRLTNLVTGTIEQTLLDEFARRVVTVGVEYQRWQDLDKLEKVFTELTKARDEIDRAWNEVAHGDEIWREGLARLASGRTITGVSAERAAKELAEWSKGVAWPACTTTLTAAQVQEIYPELNAESCRDMVRILSRTGDDSERWSADLLEVLPKEFGIQGFTKGEVNAALKRIEMILPHATSLENRVRRHTISRIGSLFASSLETGLDTPLDVTIAQWRQRYAIPEPNDLSGEAKGLMFHITADSGDVETLLLTILPRLLSGVGRPAHQWERLDLLDVYIERVRLLIGEIVSYEPVSPALHTWLTGLFSVLRRPAPTSLPHERGRLTALVAGELGDWLHEQHLPAFVADLTIDELHQVVTEADSRVVSAMLALIRPDAAANAVQLIGEDLPLTLGLTAEHRDWTPNAVADALAALDRVCRHLEALPNRLRERLLVDIGHIFAPTSSSTVARDVLAEMRGWRAAHVLLPGANLSADARLLYDVLGTGEDDADSLLLQRLPARITEVRAPYGRWPRWSVRECYLATLQNAVKEITEHGRVKTGSQYAADVWHKFRQQLDTLSDDDRRWIIKTFRDEFQP